jgi:hypothetical protein
MTILAKLSRRLKQPMRRATPATEHTIATTIDKELKAKHKILSAQPVSYYLSTMSPSDLSPSLSGDFKLDPPKHTEVIQDAKTPDESLDGPSEKVAFPIILHDVVSDPSTDDCIHWLPCGELFLICNKKKFAKKLLSKFPGNGVFTSFTRRLKRWGFERIASGPQIGAYKNENFVRGDKESAKKIKYMALKPLSMLVTRRNIVNLQTVKDLTSLETFMSGTECQNLPSVSVTPAHMSPSLRTGLLKSIAAHQQLSASLQRQGQYFNPSTDALRMLLSSGGNNTSLAANHMAAVSAPSPAIQLAMLQSMQNQYHLQQLQLSQVKMSRPVTSNANESFGEILVRTNPGLAALLLGSNNKSFQDTKPSITPTNSDLMTLLGERRHAS